MHTHINTHKHTGTHSYACTCMDTTLKSARTMFLLTLKLNGIVCTTDGTRKYGFNINYYTNGLTCRKILFYSLEFWKIANKREIFTY